MISFGILNHFHDLNKILSLDLTRRIAKNATICPTAGIEPVTLRFRCLTFTHIPHTRRGSSPSQEKSRERRTWDIRSISNVTCKNWRENLLLFSTRKPRLRRKNPTVIFGALAGYPSPSLPTFLSYFRAFFDRSRASLFSTRPLRDGLEPSLTSYCMASPGC
jgi:hypothetical protein